MARKSPTSAQAPAACRMSTVLPRPTGTAAEAGPGPDAGPEAGPDAAIAPPPSVTIRTL